MEAHDVVSRDQWLKERKALLETEKALTRQGDEVSRQRRELPWVRVDKEYVFEGPAGKQTLADLFGQHSQLVIYHFMLGPGWQEGCRSCSFLADGIDGTLAHLAARDVALAVVSRAPLAEIELFRQRMGWRFHWVSSYGSDFNFDYHVSFTEEQMAQGEVDYNYQMQWFPSDEAPGTSVFCKDGAGRVFHTYSAFGRGSEPLIGTYHLLDLVPNGRGEDGLAFTMSWVRHHDRYMSDNLVDPTALYNVPQGALIPDRAMGEHA